MSTIYAVIISLVACALAASLEGLCAGRNVRSFFATLRFPPYSAPLWVWSLIGGVYYIIFGFVLFRLLKLTAESTLKYAAITLMLFMISANALTNYIIFRARNLRLSFIIGLLFPAMDVALFVCLIQLNRIAAWALVPYLLYRIYAVWWGFALWKRNKTRQQG